MRSFGQRQNQQHDRSSADSTRALALTPISPQRKLGNRSLARLLNGPRLPIQTKLSVDNSEGPDEQEADQIADQVMQSDNPEHSKVERVPERVQTKRIAAADMSSTLAPSIVHDALRSPGQPLDSPTRRLMESRFGHDFNDVRVHADSQASESAQTLNAEAYTVGNRVFFNAGRYEPSSKQGQHLLAHELAHVLQQRSVAHTSNRLVHRQPKAKPKAPKPKPQKFSILGTKFQAVTDPASKAVTISATGKADGWAFAPAGPDLFTASRSPKNFNYVHAGGTTDAFMQKTTVHAAPNSAVTVDPITAVLGNLSIELTADGKHAAKLKNETVFSATAKRIDLPSSITGLTPVDGDLVEFGLGGGAYVFSTLKTTPATPPAATTTPAPTTPPGSTPQTTPTPTTPSPATPSTTPTPATTQTTTTTPAPATAPPPVTQVQGFFDIGSFVKYKTTTGFTSHSESDANRVKVFEDLKKSPTASRRISAEEATAFETTSLIEHDLAGVQNYDSGILSFGVAQWTVHSDLPRVLLKVPAAVFERYLGRYGLGVGTPVKALDSFAAKFIASEKDRRRFGVRNSKEGGLFLNKKDVVSDKMLKAAAKLIPTFDSLVTKLTAAKTDLTSKDAKKISDAKKVISNSFTTLSGLPGAKKNKDLSLMADGLITAATDARTAAKDMIDNCVSEEVLRGAEWVLRFELLGQDPGAQDAEVAQMRETLNTTLAFTESGVPYSTLLKSKRARSALLSSYFNTPAGTKNGMKKAVKEYRDQKVAAAKKDAADAAAAAAKAGKPAPTPSAPTEADWKAFPWALTDKTRWAFYTAAEVKNFEDIAIIRMTAGTTDPKRRRDIINKIPD